MILLVQRDHCKLRTPTTQSTIVPPTEEMKKITWQEPDMTDSKVKKQRWRLAAGALKPRLAHDSPKLLDDPFGLPMVKCRLCGHLKLSKVNERLARLEDVQEVAQSPTSLETSTNSGTYSTAHRSPTSRLLILGGGTGTTVITALALTRQKACGRSRVDPPCSLYHPCPPQGRREPQHSARTATR